MSEQVHTNDTAKTTAENGCTHQHRFGDAPHLFFCSMLVRKHKQQPSCIDYKEVNKQWIHDDGLSGGM